MASDGYAYDRQSIEEWLKRSNVSLMTGAHLPNINLMSNHSLKSAIESWKDRMKRNWAEKRTMI